MRRRVELLRTYGPHRAGSVVEFPPHIAAKLCASDGSHGGPYARFVDEAPSNRMVASVIDRAIDRAILSRVPADDFVDQVDLGDVGEEE